MNSRLNPPFDDDMSFYDEVRRNSSTPRLVRQHLDAAEPRVRVSVTNYTNDLLGYVAPRPAALSEDEKSTLKDLYTKDRSAATSTLRPAVLARGLAKDPSCPYCNIGWARQIDHFLPKSVFPEYAVAGRNLLPACADCNWLKANATIAANGSRYIHPYLDSHQLSAYLRTTVRWSGRTAVVTYSLRHTSDLSPVQFDGITRQFYELCLLQRFADCAAAEIIDQDWGSWVGNRAKFTALGFLAKKKHGRLKQQYGENHWKTALYSGIWRSTKRNTAARTQSTISSPPKCEMYFASGLPPAASLE